MVNKGAIYISNNLERNYKMNNLDLKTREYPTLKAKIDRQVFQLHRDGNFTLEGNDLTNRKQILY